jgi:hypothetical protein
MASVFFRRTTFLRAAGARTAVSMVAIPSRGTAAIHANGIDAIQFEFGTTYRQDAEVDNTAKRAAKSIVVFNEAYLRRPTD